MATHDYNIANQTALNLRGDLNNALEAIVSTNSNATAPTTTYAYMFWYDTTNDLLKMRDESNSAWIDIGYIDQGNLDFQVAGILDEDDMISNSPTHAPSQQSVKAYVDSNPSGFEFIESIDLSGDSYADFTGFDPSKYDNYTFKLMNVVPATDGVSLRLRTSSDGGVSFDSGSSDYKTGGTGFGDSTGSSISLVNNVGSASGEDGVSGDVDVFGPHLPKRTITRDGLGFFEDTGQLVHTSGCGVRNSAVEVNAVRFYFSSGLMESGTITMYGVRNSA